MNQYKLQQKCTFFLRLNRRNLADICTQNASLKSSNNLKFLILQKNYMFMCTEEWRKKAEEICSDVGF